MKIGGRRKSDYVVDQRGSSTPMRRAGMMPKLGLGWMILLGVIIYALGGDPRIILSMLQSQSQAGQVIAPRSNAPRSSADSESSKELVSVTLANLEDKWSAIFRERGATYQPPPLVLFREVINTGCGYGQAASGPFYCPADRKVYLDLSFIDDLNKLGGEGDFAIAYVVAHEVGHHVQTLINPARMRGQKSQAESIATELQADCFAGLWAHHANKERDFLEPGDIEEAITTAAAVGDDHIQRTSGRAVSPESFTHGSSRQRQEAFMVGFRSGNLDSCSFAR
jgi:predicted metalloprotease